MSESINEELIALFTTSIKHNEAMRHDIAMQTELITELMKRLFSSCGKQQKESALEPSVPTTKNDDPEPCERKLTREDFWRNMPCQKTGLHARTSPLDETHPKNCDSDALKEQLNDARELIKFYRAKMAQK